MTTQPDLPQVTVPPPPPGPDTVRPEDRLMLVLAYLGLFALIPIFTVKDSEAVRWHARQGLMVGLSSMVLCGVIGAVPFIGWCFAWLLALAFLVVDLVAMAKALKGQRWRIPVLADLTDGVLGNI